MLNHHLLVSDIDLVTQIVPLQVKSFIQGKIDEVQGQETEPDDQEVMLFWQFAQLALNAKSDVFAPGVTSSKDGSAGDTACP